MEPSWTTLEDGERIATVHDNRWLAIIGVPLTVLGLAVAIGPWFIAEARHFGAWPILAAGSLIGVGIIMAGLSLCFKYDEITADRGTGLVIRHTGLRPFRRSKIWPLTKFSEVVCLEERMVTRELGSSRHHRVRLMGAGASVLIASSLDPDQIRAEAQRWAKILDLTFRDTLGSGQRQDR
jgi:hypothetical protein